jgi:hypothetical protein
MVNDNVQIKISLYRHADFSVSFSYFQIVI